MGGGAPGPVGPGIVAVVLDWPARGSGWRGSASRASAATARTATARRRVRALMLDQWAPGLADRTVNSGQLAKAGRAALAASAR